VSLRSGITDYRSQTV